MAARFIDCDAIRTLMHNGSNTAINGNSNRKKKTDNDDDDGDDDNSNNTTQHKIESNGQWDNKTKNTSSNGYPDNKIAYFR